MAARAALTEELNTALAEIDAARAQAQDRDALAERLTRVLAQLELVLLALPLLNINNIMNITI